MEVLGIDIGGSGVKGAPVNVVTGQMLAERHRIETPTGARPKDVLKVVDELVQHFNWRGPIGCTFPAIVRNGVILTAANVSDTWIGKNGAQMIAEATGCPTVLINDADAAGIAEMRFGAGVGKQGVVLVLTFGTGVGSALFVNGHLHPNTEFGHLIMHGESAERFVSAKAREDEDLSWKQWSKRLNAYFERIELIVSPDLIIFGGGVSKKHDKFFDKLKTEADLVPAALRNNAGIVGAAMAAADAFNPAAPAAAG